MAQEPASGPSGIMPPDPNIYITDGGEPRTICVSPWIPPTMHRMSTWRVEDFDLHKELYRGKTSLLYMATDKRSGIQIALKLYRKRKLSTLNRYQVEREIRIHIRMDHENIIKLYAAFEDEKNVYMVQEFAGGGDLFEDLKRNGGQYKEKQAVREVIAPFLNALQALHSVGVVHRDIKPENILLTSARVIKIADFGLSIDVNMERPVTRAGTLDYMAPEVLICPDKRRPEENKDKVLLAYTAQVDAWAVGILAYELLVGYPPFEQESRAATYEHIMYKEPKFPTWVSEEARRFIAAALNKNAQQRLNVFELAGQPWILHWAQRPSVHDATPAAPSRLSRTQASLSGTPQPAGSNGGAVPGAGVVAMQGSLSASGHSGQLRTVSGVTAAAAAVVSVNGAAGVAQKPVGLQAYGSTSSNSRGTAVADDTERPSPGASPSAQSMSAVPSSHLSSLAATTAAATGHSISDPTFRSGGSGGNSMSLASAAASAASVASARPAAATSPTGSSNSSYRPATHQVQQLQQQQQQVAVQVHSPRALGPGTPRAQAGGPVGFGALPSPPGSTCSAEATMALKATPHALRPGEPLQRQGSIHGYQQAAHMPASPGPLRTVSHNLAGLVIDTDCSYSLDEVRSGGTGVSGNSAPLDSPSPNGARQLPSPRSQQAGTQPQAGQVLQHSSTSLSARLSRLAAPLMPLPSPGVAMPSPPCNGSNGGAGGNGVMSPSMRPAPPLGAAGGPRESMRARDGTSLDQPERSSSSFIKPASGVLSNDSMLTQGLGGVQSPGCLNMRRPVHSLVSGSSPMCSARFDYRPSVNDESESGADRGSVGGGSQRQFSAAEYKLTKQWSVTSSGGAKVSNAGGVDASLLVAEAHALLLANGPGSPSAQGHVRPVSGRMLSGGGAGPGSMSHNSSGRPRPSLLRGLQEDPGPTAMGSREGSLSGAGGGCSGRSGSIQPLMRDESVVARQDSMSGQMGTNPTRSHSASRQRQVPSNTGVASPSTSMNASDAAAARVERAANRALANLSVEDEYAAVGRMNSETQLTRAGLTSAGRSFTGQRASGAGRSAQAPLVSKVEQYKAGSAVLGTDRESPHSARAAMAAGAHSGPLRML